jgi:hypothetical protein
MPWRVSIKTIFCKNSFMKLTFNWNLWNKNVPSSHHPLSINFSLFNYFLTNYRIELNQSLQSCYLNSSQYHNFPFNWKFNTVARPIMFSNWFNIQVFSSQKPHEWWNYDVNVILYVVPCMILLKIVFCSKSKMEAITGQA